MEDIKKQNAVLAFLEEYKKAINELQNIISDVNELELIEIADPLTASPECKSIQTILTHVVSSGYSYCVYIQNHRNIDSKRPEQRLRLSSFEYSNDLNQVLEFTNQTFAGIYDHELEVFNNSKKIATRWGQVYDIEQMMEHAIVHILRHRRQIQNFKKIIRRL
ncbi:MAG: DinB family protein [Ferruginibacter sp.]